MAAPAASQQDLRKSLSLSEAGISCIENLAEFYGEITTIQRRITLRGFEVLTNEHYGEISD